MSKKHINIENVENDILQDLEAGDFISSLNNHEEIELAQRAASQHLKRDSRINIRVSSADLNMVRRIAAQEGLPYQTLLSSVIHKFVSGRLVDVNTRH